MFTGCHEFKECGDDERKYLESPRISYPLRRMYTRLVGRSLSSCISTPMNLCFWFSNLLRIMMRILVPSLTSIDLVKDALGQLAVTVNIVTMLLSNLSIFFMLGHWSIRAFYSSNMHYTVPEPTNANEQTLYIPQPLTSSPLITLERLQQERKREQDLKNPSKKTVRVYVWNKHRIR